MLKTTVECGKRMWKTELILKVLASEIAPILIIIYNFSMEERYPTTGELQMPPANKAKFT